VGPLRLIPLTKVLVMSSDASQSILRLTLLACATAAFMVVWTGDSSRTTGRTLAERNRQVFPAHAIARPSRTQLAEKAPRMEKRDKRVDSNLRVAAPRKVEPRDALETLPAGSYRVVFDDGRVEWLTVIDRNGASGGKTPAAVSAMVNGERAHVIRVSTRTGTESAVR
jgi:hypothetical protein